MNAMDTVRLIHDATERVARWPDSIRGPVLRARPQIVQDRGYSPLEWMVTVEVFRQEDESHATAAERLALYMTAHTERWDQTPTLNRVQKDALRRKDRDR